MQSDSLPQMRDIDKIIISCDKLKKLIEKHEESLKQAAVSIASNITDENITAKNMEGIEDSYLTSIALFEAVQKYSSNANSLKQYVDRAIRGGAAGTQSQEIGMGENLADKFLKDDYKKPLNTDAYKNDKRLRDLKREIHSINHTTPLDMNDEDEDIVVASQSINVTCPISQANYVEPVQAKVCGHIFSKAAVLSMFKGANTLNCPVAGCGKQIQKNELERSPVKEELIKREIRRREKEARERLDQEDITEV